MEICRRNEPEISEYLNQILNRIAEKNFQFSFSIAIVKFKTNKKVAGLYSLTEVAIGHPCINPREGLLRLKMVIHPASGGRNARILWVIADHVFMPFYLFSRFILIRSLGAAAGRP
jgi:hypothetical protein